MRIIAALDDSDASDAVLQVAAALAARVDADVVALHAREGAETEAPARLGRLTAARRTPLEVADGRVVPVIVDRLSADDVAFGVVGSRGRPDGKLPAGHTAIAVASAVRTPIVVTPPTVGAVGIRRLLVPLEGTHEGAAAVAEVVGRLAAAGVEVVPLHIFTPATVPSFWDQPHHAAPAWSSGFLTRFGPAAADTLCLRSGDVADAMLEVIGSEAIDLVTLAWSQDLTGGHAPVVRALLARSPVPVLLVPVRAPE